MNDKNAVDQYTLLDLTKRDNLLLTREGEVKYVDSGTACRYNMFIDERIRELVQLPIAQLEMVVGKTPEQIVDDPEYADLMQDFKRNGFHYADPDVKNAFEHLVHERA